jgi:predicted outer membrane protein
MLRRLMLSMPALLAATLLYAASAQADCLLPAPPSHIPDGDSANQQEMVAAMRTFKQYNEDVDEYTKCLEFEQRQNHISSDAQVLRRNIAINQLEIVVARFNEQVRRFKARHT